MKEIELKARSGFYESMCSKRKRKQTNFYFYRPEYFDSEAKECNKPVKELDQEKIEKSESNELSDSDSDESVGVRKKYMKENKRFGLIRRLEQDEIAKSNNFLASDDDSETNFGLDELMERATDTELLHGRVINDKIQSSSSQHQTSIRLKQQTLKATARRKIQRANKKRNGSTTTNYTYNININNSGATFNNSMAPLSMFQSIFDTQRAAYQASNNESDINHCLDELNRNNDNREWVEKYSIAKKIFDKHGRGGLRRGYNAINDSVSEWFDRQHSHLTSLDFNKQYLLWQLKGTNY